MKKAVAIVVSFILLQCEWHYSFAQIFSTESCSTQCCASSCDDSGSGQESNDDNNTANDLMKNCCTNCCYLPMASGKFDVFATRTETVFPENLLFNISFVSDCFHPPELV